MQNARIDVYIQQDHIHSAMSQEKGCRFCNMDKYKKT